MLQRSHVSPASPPKAVTTLIPARMDRLPWSRFHWLIVVALGITWILDGLAVTLKGAISGVLQEPQTLHFTSAEIGMIASFYLAGAVVGSLEMRALAIAFFYAIGTGAGGVVAPWIFGTLIGTGSRVNVLYGYAFAGFLMLVAAAIEVFLGVRAERRSLEDVAAPLSAAAKA